MHLCTCCRVARSYITLFDQCNPTHMDDKIMNVSPDPDNPTCKKIQAETLHLNRMGKLPIAAHPFKKWLQKNI